MAGKFVQISDLNNSNDNKFWKIKARVIKLWKVPSFNTKFQKPTLDMVVVDEKRDRIHCTVRNPQLKYFEGLIEEDKVYIISNFDVEENSLKFKPTRHTFRVFFRKDTQVKEVVDDIFPLNGFDFIPNSVILAEKKEDGFLVDIIGTLAAKTRLRGYTKNDKTTNYVEIQLDDYQ